MSAYRDPQPVVSEVPEPQPNRAEVVLSTGLAIVGFAFFVWNCWRTGTWVFLLPTIVIMIALQVYRHVTSTPQAVAKRRLALEAKAERWMRQVR